MHSQKFFSSNNQSHSYSILKDLFFKLLMETERRCIKVYRGKYDQERFAMITVHPEIDDAKNKIETSKNIILQEIEKLEKLDEKHKYFYQYAFDLSELKFNLLFMRIFIGKLNKYWKPVAISLGILSEDANNLVVQIGYRLREFNNNGHDLSNKVSELPKVLTSRLNKISHSLSVEEKTSLQDFFMDITESFTKILQLSDPFPEITKLISAKSKLNFSDITYCMNVLHDQTVNPMHNEHFKTRAVQCVLLSLAYEKLLKSPVDVKDIADLLIIPMQRLTRISLFSGDGLKGINSLKNCLGDQYSVQMENLFLQIDELNCRASMIKIAVNEIKTAIDFVVARISKSKYITYSRSIDAFTNKFVADIVTCVMEAPIKDKTYSIDIKEKINQQYLKPMCNDYISPCDYLHYDFNNLLSKIAVDNKLLTGKLKETHENVFLTDSEKLTDMKQAITNACFSSKQNHFQEFLSGFIKKDMVYYVENDSNDLHIEPGKLGMRV